MDITSGCRHHTTPPQLLKRHDSYIKFIPKSIVGSYLSAFKLNPLFVALSTVIEVLFVGAIWKYYDTKTMLFFLSYALGGILILELINYLEHYGLQRKLKEDGTYERVNIRHSWNAPSPAFKLPLLQAPKALRPPRKCPEALSDPLQLRGLTTTASWILGLPPYRLLPQGKLNGIQKWFDMMDPLVEEYREVGQRSQPQVTGYCRAEG
jgi:hypothetical protein